MLGRVKLDNTPLTCDQGNFNQITARSRNRTLVTVVRDTYTATVPSASHEQTFMCEQTPYPIWSWCWRKSYEVLCERLNPILGHFSPSLVGIFFVSA